MISSTLEQSRLERKRDHVHDFDFGRPGVPMIDQDIPIERRSQSSSRGN